MRSPEQEPRPYDRIPQELQQLPQWVNWRNDKGRKVPINPHTLRNAGVNWPKTWSNFDRAREIAHLRNGLGLGFVITEDDPYTCVDLDNCIDNHGQIDDQTREILDLLSGWVELSPSETGLHIWVKNDQPVSRRVKGLEVYSYSRWMTVTGRSNPQVPLEIPNRTAEIEELSSRFMPQVERSFIPTEPVPMSDFEIWHQLFNSEYGDFYARLYDGDLSVCDNDHSLGVITLANQLAWMTDYDSGRMKSLLYETKLVRDKWDEMRGDITWIDYQIHDAIAYISGRQK